LKKPSDVLSSSKATGISPSHHSTLPPPAPLPLPKEEKSKDDAEKLPSSSSSSSDPASLPCLEGLSLSSSPLPVPPSVPSPVIPIPSDHSAGKEALVGFIRESPPLPSSSSKEQSTNPGSLTKEEILKASLQSIGFTERLNDVLINDLEVTFLSDLLLVYGDDELLQEIKTKVSKIDYRRFIVAKEKIEALVNTKK
jgi:hypothetical protein